MKIPFTRACLSVAALAMLALPAMADEKAPETAPPVEQKEAPATAPAPQIDEKVNELMAEYGRVASEARAVSLEVAFEMAAQKEGKAAQRLTGRYLVTLQKPDRVALKLWIGPQPAEIYSDGKTISSYRPGVKQYMSADAPPDPRQILATGGLGTAYLRGFLVPEPGVALLTGVIKAVYVGAEKLDDADTHHLRCETGRGLAWDLWLLAGERPLLRRLALQFDHAPFTAEKDVSGSMVFNYTNWKLDPDLPADSFIFTPPEGVQKVEVPTEVKVNPRELVGKPAPEFDLPLLAGGQASLQSHRGKQAVVLHFWSSRASTCRQSMPILARAAQEFKDKDAAFYFVNLGEQATEIGAFLTELKLDVPVAMDEKGAVGNEYRAKSLPLTVVIGKDGVIRSVYAGVPADFERSIKTAIDAAMK